MAKTIVSWQAFPPSLPARPYSLAPKTPFPSFSTPAAQAQSQILAGKSQSLNEGEKTWLSKVPACNLQNLLDDSFFRDRVHQIH